MNHYRLPIAAIACALVSCATPTPHSAAPAAPASKPATSVATPAPAAASQSGAVAAPASAGTDRAAHAELLRQARMKGYKMKSFKGRTVYCRPETPLGTRFAETQCLTESVLAETIRRETATQDDMQRSRACSTTDCVAN